MGESTGELTFERVWTMFQETDRKFQETDRKLREMAEERDREFQEMTRKTDREIEKVNRAIGRLGNKIGELIEQLMAADIVNKFNAFGYIFTKAGRRISYRDHANEFLAEVDILLENGEYALAVEVKTDLSTEDIKDHTHRMEILRSYAKEHQDTRSYIGAVAGGIIRDPVRDFALKCGFYVIEQSGETIRIRKPEEPNKVKIW
jgi:predicted AAA+ superfamily ATPase